VVDDPTVRRATASDIGTLVELMQEFYSESGYSLDQRHAEAAFSQLFHKPDLGCVWLVEQQGTVAGHAVLTLHYIMEHAGFSAYIDDLFVKPEFRRQGIARALLAELWSECERRACRSVYVEVGSDNSPAITLYRRLGLRPLQDGRVMLGGLIGHGGT
jgi:ribosomal protein S18 acetylase RimI-like enzyme